MSAETENRQSRDAPGPDRAVRGYRLGLAAPFGELLWVTLKMWVVLAVGVAYAIRLRVFTTETYFFWRQDLPVAILGLVLIAALGLAPSKAMARLAPALEARAAPWVAGLALVVLVAGAIGPQLVFGGYTFSLDEWMANSDAKIFASGRLVAPLAPEWRPYQAAMAPIFTLPLADHGVWASAYLPVNAAMRALASRAGVEVLVNPLLSAFGVIATWGVGRRLWPSEPRLAIIAAALLGGSSQLIVMSMTAYAMPAHLALNMAWLWLFLRGGRLGHAGAICVGFFACGIHQLAFHPMFVAPFILQLWLDRRWALASLYTLAYAAMGLFWVEWWSISLALAGLAPAAHATGGGWFVQRVEDVFGTISVANIGPMAECLARFVTWQNPLVAPLALAFALAAERAKGHMRSLVLGVFLTLVVMLFLMPTQTHGWGYRYLHGLLGSIALIAAWGWRRMTAALAPERQAAAAGGLVAACAASLLVLTPLRAWQTWAYVHPYALASAAIAHSGADVVLVDDSQAVSFNFGTEVRNDPFLTNVPKTMALAVMGEGQVRRLCETRRVMVFDGRSAKDFGVDVVARRPDPRVQALREEMAGWGCDRVIRVQPD